MRFGGTGSTAAAITAGAAAEQDDDIARIGRQTDDIGTRCRCDNGADLHTLCHVIRMIDFIYKTGCQTDLIAVGTVAGRGACRQLSLRQFALQCLIERYGRVCCTGYTHCLIYIGTAGKRIADCTAEAGCRTAERLDLGRMVMGLVFEIDEPLLFFSIDIDRYDDAACVDLVGLLLILQLALFLELLRTHQCHIHQADKFIRTSLVDLVVILAVLLICALDGIFVIAVTEKHAGQLCLERRMTAVIRPVGIQYADFRHRRISVLFIAEIIADEHKILIRHGQIQGIIQLFKFCRLHLRKAVKDLHIVR